MLRSPIFPRDLPLFSEDLDILSDVLDDVCRHRQIARSSPRAEQIASRLIELYRQGVKDPKTLAALAKAYL